MRKKRIRYTFLRNGIYYLQITLPDSNLFRRSLLTDSYRAAFDLMISITPQILLLKKRVKTLMEFCLFLDSLIPITIVLSKKNPTTISSFSSDNDMRLLINRSKNNSTHTHSLSDSWSEFKKWKISKREFWSVEQAKKNERSFESILALLGHDYNVYNITRKTMDRVMESIEGLPDARKPPYNKMSVKERLEQDDISEDDLIGASTYNSHIKIFSQFFTRYIVKDKGLLERSPMEGIKQKKEISRYGVYTKAEIKKYIKYALSDKTNASMKWIILLLVYTGARRGEIAKLKSTQVKFDEDCQRYYLHLAEGGTGKTDNATREVALHSDLIRYGMLEYVSDKEGYLFSEIASTSLNQLTQDFIAVRDSLAIPALDKDGSRRAMHSLRHTFITYASGWMKDNTHLQSVIGHSKTGLGITKRYVHTIPLESLLYIVDGLDWKL